MTPFELIIALCAVAATVALVAALRALRKTAGRADEVLHLVEREIRPMASQIESLAEEVRHAGAQRQCRTWTASASSYTGPTRSRIRWRGSRWPSAASRDWAATRRRRPGVKQGLDVFIKRLRSR